MLTAADLKSIRNIVREEVEVEVKSIKSELNSQIIMSRMRVEESIDELKDSVKNLEIKIVKLNNGEVEEDML